MKNFLCIFIFLISSGYTQAQISVSQNNRFLQTKDGKPFFWLGDTDWEMVHRLTREEIEEFITIRESEGFNILQVVALAEFKGLRQPNRYGDLPLIDEDPEKLAVTPGNDPEDEEEYDYWDHVDFAIETAAKHGMYIGLLPTWGDKVAHLWGDGPVIFNEKNAEAYGRSLAKRYAGQHNIIWILGGDRPAVYRTKSNGIEKEYDDRPVWRAMAKGIEEVQGKEAFITYHPWGNEQSSSQYVHNESWLDMNAFQSGHGSRETQAWEWVTRDLALRPQKPTLDMEPCYEDHPVNPWDGKWTRESRGYFSAYDVRARIYRGVFAGGCGVTYGHHHIWQFMNKALYDPVNVGDTIIPWREAAHAQAAEQMKYLKSLMLSRPYFSRIPDQEMIRSGQGTTYRDYIAATRDENGSYAMIYLPRPEPVTIDLNRITGEKKNAWWLDPASGKVKKVVVKANSGDALFTPPPGGKDWVLVIDDASKKFGPPGPASN